MKVYDILPDPRLAELFEALLESGGVIHGGCLRDLIRDNVYYKFHDIDVYYDHESKLAQQVTVFNSSIIKHLEAYIKLKPSFKNIDRLTWIDSPLDDYGYEIDKIELGVPCEGYKHQAYREEYPMVGVDLMYRKKKFTAKNNFLDFDINSLYLLPDGTISSSLGSDKVEKVISNIKEGKCRIMRSDLPDWRITHILDKGYTCNLTAFL